MHEWKADVIFVLAPSEDVVGNYCYHSGAATNTRRGSSILDLKSRSNNEVVEYFRLAEYSKPKNPIIKEPSKWIPFKEIFMMTTSWSRLACGWTKIEI